MLSSNFRRIGCRLGPMALRALTARCFSALPQGHVVVALGGNALLKRGEKMTDENQRKNLATGIASLKNLINDNVITLVHGNGPQVGLLMLESASYEKQTGLPPSSLDVLDAETEGMIGYLIEEELQSHIAKDRGLVTVLTQVVCDPKDPAFQNPTKFVGPIYTKDESEKLGLPVKRDGEHYRRVVPSPLPVRIVDHQMRAIRQLTEQNSIVICAGGGGIPVVPAAESFANENASYHGVEAVIDKDRAAAMVGKALNANGLLILTDVAAISTNFGKAGEEQKIRTATPKAMERLMDHFPSGSMGPKVESAIDFVRHTPNGWAAIGSINEADRIMAGKSGTVIRNAENEILDDYIAFYNHPDDCGEKGMFKTAA